MPTLSITPARADVLRAAQGEQLHRRRSAANEKTTDRIGGYSGRDVTRVCESLRSAQPSLIRLGRRLGPSIYSPQVWELTADGVKALADYDATERK